MDTREVVNRAKVSGIFETSPGVLEGVLYGDMPTKSNQRKVYKLAGGRRLFGKSAKALNFVERVEGTAKYTNAKGPLQGATSRGDLKAGLRPLVLSAVVYGASWSRDLDVELLPDALQKAGFINNDRAIREKHYWWRLDRRNPRVEFSIRKAEEREV